jgi:hypothetical protein
VGPFAQVLPTGGFAPREITAFTRFGPNGTRELKDVDRVLAVAGTVLRRRGRALTPVLDAVYRGLAESGAGRSPDTVLPLRRTA